MSKPSFDLDERLESIPDSAFDGHTDFQKLTPEQKIEWLSAAVQFYYEYSLKFKKA